MAGWRALRAVLFDVDGTLAETERDGHRRAFNLAFRDHGLGYEWGVAEYGRLLAIPGGRHRLKHFLEEQGNLDADRVAGELHVTKTAHFEIWLQAGSVKPRPGVPQLLRDLVDAGLMVAIVTTGSQAWVHPLLRRMFPDVEFATVVTGSDVQRLKPDGEAYQRAVADLGLSADEVVAIEDSPPGLAAAVAADVRCLVVTSSYTRGDRFPRAAAVLPGYLAVDLFEPPALSYFSGGVTVDALLQLHADRHQLSADLQPRLVG